MSAKLDRLARHHGITLAYDDPFNDGKRPVPDATKRLILEGLGQDENGPPHGPSAPRRMAVPEGARCFSPPSLASSPGWGIFCQLYELRSARNWGIGDFSDLEVLAGLAGRAGADFLGINPVHALFLADPDRRSPFFPSNRRFLNPLYIAPDRLGLKAPDDVAALREADLLDYPALVAVKLAALRDAFHRGVRTERLEAFAAAEGEALARHALFEAISAHMVAEGKGAGWRSWPEALQFPESDAVAALKAELADEVRFHTWLQMIAREQIEAAADVARAAGMRIGLYLDLAVGEAPDGSATWSGAAAALPGLSVGAPPDMFATEGQNWGLAAPSPTALRAADFAPFRDMIEAQLRSAGALRIDHAMALWQLFLVPEGASPAEGTHLRFPFEDMVRALADLSQRHEAVVIGEDLGFVPKGFRSAMARANILSYRILVFEQTEKGFKGLARYPEASLACISTHDLPVLEAWWRGEDVERRREHGLVDEDRSDMDARHRVTERQDLVRALRRAGVLRGRLDAEAAEMPPEVLDACHRFLARTKSRLVGVRLADLVGPAVPTNLPGTLDEYPNWKPRSPTDLSDLETHPVFAATAALMRQERPRPEDATE